MILDEKVSDDGRMKDKITRDRKKHTRVQKRSNLNSGIINERLKIEGGERRETCRTCFVGSPLLPSPFVVLLEEVILLVLNINKIISSLEDILRKENNRKNK